MHYNINVLGAILTVQEAIKRFGEDGGSIINLSSIVGSHPVSGALLYASTKGAIETLTKGLALELAPRKMAPFWLGRRRLAGSVGSRISRWRCSWHQTSQPGSPGKSFGPQAVSL